MATLIHTLRERAELARFHHKNGRPAAAFDALLSAVELLVLDVERREIAAAEAGARVDCTGPARRAASKAEKPEVLPLG